MTKQSSDTVKIVIQTIIFFAFNFSFSSCHFNTAISYRLEKDIKYVKEDGYIISCEKDDNQLVVGTYTPESWNSDFYYDYLNGIKSNKKIKINGVDIKFIETADTLLLNEVRDKREYIYTSPNLTTIVNNNKHLKITVFFKEEGSDSSKQKEFELTKFKNTYSTGTFPH